MRRDIPAPRLGALRTGNRGLTTREAADQRKRYGRNEILEVAANPWIQLTRDTLKDPMIWFLVGTGLVYVVLESYVEAVTLLVAILPLIGMDAFLHRRTQAATEGLRQQIAAKAVAFRDGAPAEIPTVELVPGDLVRVSAGEPFPADGLIVAGENLQSDESSLTGEAHPVAKALLTAIPSETPESEDAVWVEGEHWGFAGTRLLTGRAHLRIVFTGAQTLYGEIIQAAAQGVRERTPLQNAISNLVSLLIVSAGVLCLILAGIRLRQGHDWVDALVSAATLAVAALPEEFPVVFTVFLGVGVYRLARQKTLVRRGVSVENIGRVTCICCDKTGTITEGRLRLEHLYPGEACSEQQLLYLAALASRRETGDPMDRAIIDRLGEATHPARRAVLLAGYPYTEQRRRETAVLRIDGQILAVTKGSPETLLPMSDLDPSRLDLWAQQVDRLAAEGHKVLACLYWELTDTWSGGEPDRGGRFAGLLACEDPIREGVPEAVRQCRDAGIRIVMVTGDHPATAACIAREMGLDGEIDRVILGDDLVRRLEGGAVTGVDFQVVARALPMQKLVLVQALKAAGETVAVTGDGVNDVPALQAADVGIAMGERGTRSAREVASIVLLDDNFSTIVRAIAEGRQLFRNLRLSFQYLLMIHIPLVITATFIPLAGYPILYLPIHIVWLEAIIHPTALLVFQELPARGPLEAMGKRQAARFFSRREWCMIALAGAAITALIMWSYERSLVPGRNVEHARAMAMVTLICASASITALLSRLRTKSAWFMTIATLALSLPLVQMPELAAYLHLQPLHGDDWQIAAAGGLLAVALPVLLFSVRHKRKRGRY